MSFCTKCSKLIIFGGISIVLALSIFFFAIREKSYVLAEYFPFEGKYKYKFEGIYYSGSEENLELKVDFNYLGEQVKEGKPVYVREIDIYVDYKLVNSGQVYFQVNKNNEVLELAKKQDGKVDWYENPVIRYPAKMKIGEEYVFNDSIYGDEIKRSRKMILKEVKNLTINGEVYDNCLIIETKYFEDDELKVIQTDSIYKGDGFIQSKEENFDGNNTEGTFVLTLERKLKK